MDEPPDVSKDQVNVAPPKPDAACQSDSTALARAEARIVALEELVSRQDDELRFLRQLTVDTLGRRAS
jgi:hypothetical protein